MQELTFYRIVITILVIWVTILNVRFEYERNKARKAIMYVMDFLVKAFMDDREKDNEKQ